jgi:hypothetical protein
MALRVARGLFRLWLVVSVLWIGGVTVVTWSVYRPINLATSDPTPKQVNRFDASDHPTTIQVQTPDRVIHEFPAGTAAEVIDRVMGSYWGRHEITQAVELALIPPTLMLVLGSAFGWAFRGFRS